ncbi:MAG TPA: HD domain-containing phosphohydrolase [Planctomycetota bacterium]|nr:HD domain-containing phosphohydrolase [Planctomycetota bacterium]
MTKPHILVVDDDEPNRGLLRRVLGAVGYEVTEAADGEEAVEAVLRRPPDLVLMDLEMPRLDGYGALRILKEDPRTRLIPVVMLTSHDQFNEKIRAVEYGVDDYLHKPLNIPELTARVKSLVQLKRFTDELEHASGVLEGVALCVENRDRYTGNHCRRLSSYATRVGRVLGLPEEDLRILHLGGVFHDLGKIAVSDTILNKPGRLTPEEFATMKSHSTVGADLLARMRTLEKVLPLVRNHHEKLDGSGYPDGLAGKAIPILVRILSVVDVFDALHTRRAYKDSFPLDRCFQILREEVAKGWWDRDVVEALSRTLSSEGLAEGS